MKKMLMVFAVATVFVACKNKTNNGLSTDKNMVLTDTALLNRSGLLSDTARGASALAVPNVNGTTTTSSTTTTVTTTTTNGTGKIAPVKSAAVKKSPVRRSSAGRSNTASRSNTGSNSNSGGTTADAPVRVQRDKGWSDAAKGTAIGAGSGAVLGAVLAKDKVKGAVIGGVIGGAGGYAIGRDRDRKSGRVARTKASKQQ
jgi:YMGG-like Gly-zipper